MNDAVELPLEVQLLAEQWGFVPAEELPGGHCSRVFADESRVLKVSFQGEELTFGLEASLKLEAAGGPKVFQVDRGHGVVLMERLQPGSILAEATLGGMLGEEVFVRLAAQIRRLDPSSAMLLRDYVECDPPVLTVLEDSTRELAFLHGDLHHGNILLDGESWRPIDPKGLIGDPHYECVAFLRNPTGHLDSVNDLAALTEKRILSMAKAMDLNPWRIAAWGYVDQFNSTEDDSAWGRLKANLRRVGAEALDGLPLVILDTKPRRSPHVKTQ